MTHEISKLNIKNIESIVIKIEDFQGQKHEVELFDLIYCMNSELSIDSTHLSHTNDIKYENEYEITLKFNCSNYNIKMKNRGY